MAQIVLASGSPRRRQLLCHIGLKDFLVRVPQTEEPLLTGLSPASLVEHISREKADAARLLCAPTDIIITADTMVFLDGMALGKPRDEAHALSMLRALQGRSHQVYTGLTLMQGMRQLTESESTLVHFRPATEAELLFYIRSGESMDKAGAYGIQGKGALLVEGIEGDFFNVMGLPLLRLSRMLSQFGLDLFLPKEGERL